MRTHFRNSITHIKYLWDKRAMWREQRHSFVPILRRTPGYTHCVCMLLTCMHVCICIYMYTYLVYYVGNVRNLSKLRLSWALISFDPRVGLCLHSTSASRVVDSLHMKNLFVKCVRAALFLETLVPPPLPWPNHTESSTSLIRHLHLCAGCSFPHAAFYCIGRDWARKLVWVTTTSACARAEIVWQRQYKYIFAETAAAQQQ